MVLNSVAFAVVILPTPSRAKTRFRSVTDVVFFIYLYQRWIYRVDPNRVNEYGTSGLDHSSENSAQASVGDTATTTAAAITDKPEEEKKND